MIENIEKYDNKKILCPRCETIYNNIDQLRKHPDIEKNILYYQCLKCDKKIYFKKYNKED